MAFLFRCLLYVYAKHYFLCLLQLRKMQEKLARMQAEIESKRPAVQPNGNIKTHDV